MTTTCSLDACATRHYARGLCEKHYRRNHRHGSPDTILQPSDYVRRGATHPFWVGDAITYGGMHDRIRYIRGVPEAQTCACGAVAEEWAYTHSRHNERSDPRGRPYSPDVADYAPMCRPCHRLADGNQA